MQPNTGHQCSHLHMLHRDSTQRHTTLQYFITRHPVTVLFHFKTPTLHASSQLLEDATGMYASTRALVCHANHVRQERGYA
jgi:hypothetical protein